MTLDTSRITIPGGKFGYLLENPGEAEVFSDSMGFDKATLGSALRNQLVENFGNASPEVPRGSPCTTARVPRSG